MSGFQRQYYGGMMPLELPQGTEFYQGDGVLAVNCGRAALFYALKDARPRRLHLPRYLCQATGLPAERLGIPLSYYDIDMQFMPILPELPADEALLWVNYYGLMDAKALDRVSLRFPLLILDNTHAFFAPPRPGAYTLYSCRKFFGVADGGYLIKEGLAVEAKSAKATAGRYLHRLEYYEGGHDRVYDDYVQNELTLANHYTAMSSLTRRIMQSLPYQFIFARRKENYHLLQERLGHLRGLDLAADPDYPMTFVMMAPDPSFVERLHKRDVRAVNWWRHVMDETRPDSFEFRLADRLVQLPIDQRYDKQDMVEIADRVLDAYAG